MLRHVKAMIVKKWQGLARAVKWPPIPASALREADSIPALQALAAGYPFLGFNGQILRTKYLMSIFAAAGCTGFLETGTYYGGTSLLARELFDTEVNTAEVVRKYMLHAMIRAKLARLDCIHFHFGDSRAMLDRWLCTGVGGHLPMIYLDAHWYNDLPLADELAIAVRQGNCLVVIDDFRVPDNDDFGYDSYHGKAIELESVAPHLPSDAWAYIPAHSASQETGSRRGTLIVGIGVAEPVLADLPRSLLQRVRLSG